MIRGASLGPPSRPRNRNKKPIQAARVVPTAVAVSGAKENPAAGIELGERDPDALVAAPDPTAAADELIGLDFKRE